MTLVMSAKVNNSISDTVRVTGPNPTISWDLENREISVPNSDGTLSRKDFVEQATYEVRVGTSSSNLGNNSFSGDKLSTGIVESQSRQVVYDGLSISRGNVYYGQVRVADTDGESSDWETFSFRYNSIPSASLVSIDPSSPGISQDLELSYSYSDGDNDQETGSRIRWYKNGVYQHDFDGMLIIPSRYLRYGDKWMVDVMPFDGYEYGKRETSNSVTVAEAEPSVDYVRIFPENPNENDILKIRYLFNSDSSESGSQIRWFVNGDVKSDYNDLKTVRIKLSDQDKVRVEIAPFDGVNFGKTVVSETVTVSSAPFVVKDLRVDGQINPMSVLSLSPVISWDYYRPEGKEQEYVSVKVGSFFGSDDLFSETVETDQNTFIIPTGIFNPGRDYYVSVAVSDTETFDRYTSTKIRTVGSHWGSSVSNSTGWTIESSLVVDQSAEYDANKYQVIRFQDGAKFGEVRIFRTKISFVSGSEVFSNVLPELDGVLSVTITGQGSNAMVYVNRGLVIDASGLLTQTTSSKSIEIGSVVQDSLLVRYKYISYSTSGKYSPLPTGEYGDLNSYADLQIFPFVEFPQGKVQDIEGFVDSSLDFKVVGVNPRDESQGGSIYLISSKSPVRYPTANRTFTPINKLRVSQNGKYMIMSHANGAALFKNYPIVRYDHAMDFSDTDRKKPDDLGWELLQNFGTDISSFDSSGLVIDASFVNVGKKQRKIIAAE